MKRTGPPSMGPPLYTSSPIRKKPIRKPGSPRQATERDKSNTRCDGHIVNISRIPHVSPAPWHQVITAVRPKAPVTSCVTLAPRPAPLEGGEAPGQGKAQDLPAQEKLLQHITMCVKPTTGCSEAPRAALCVAPREYKPYIDAMWPNPTVTAVEQAPSLMAMYAKVKATGVPNYMSAKVQVPSDMNCDEWDKVLVGYHDGEIAQYLRYGWPSSYTAPQPPTPTFENHSSATKYETDIQNFLTKEISHNAMAGPFQTLPFHPWTQISPLMTAPKNGQPQEKGKPPPPRRVIIDLSFPEFRSVNDGIGKHTFQGRSMQYRLPTVEDVAQELIATGKGAWMWKTDLSRAYRQMRVDPLDYPLLAVQHKGGVYLDLCPSFGARCSGAAQQRISVALCYIMARDHGVRMHAYVDDFIGIHSSKEAANKAFAQFKALCERLGIKLAPDKSVPPTQDLEWLGVRVTSTDMVLSVPRLRLVEVVRECNAWLNRKQAVKQEIQSLVGKLAFVSQCIPPARRFMARILHTLRQTHGSALCSLDQGFHLDVRWFADYAAEANGRRLLQPSREQIDIVCDACLEAGGAYSNAAKSYYNIKFPRAFRARHHISQSEAINAILSLKTLIPKGSAGKEIRVTTDNMAAKEVLHGGKARDLTMAACARELALIEAVHDVRVVVNHAPGESEKLKLADALSRAFKDPALAQLAQELVKKKGLKFVIPVRLKYVFSPS